MCEMLAQDLRHCDGGSEREQKVLELSMWHVDPKTNRENCTDASLMSRDQTAGRYQPPQALGPRTRSEAQGHGQTDELSVPRTSSRGTSMKIGKVNRLGS